MAEEPAAAPEMQSVLQTAAATHTTRPNGVFFGIPSLSLITLAVCSLVTLAYFIGYYTAPGRAVDPALDIGNLAGGGQLGQPVQQQQITTYQPPALGGGQAGQQRPLQPVSNSGSHVLVLLSVSQATTARQRKFEDEAIKLNNVVRQNPDLRIPALFGVRRPLSGGLQLVFGKQGNSFGLDKDDYSHVRDAMRAKDGPGYLKAYWLPLQ